jgi:hypothetical protein
MTGEPRNRSEREPDEYEPVSMAMHVCFTRESGHGSARS